MPDDQEQPQYPPRIEAAQAAWAAAAGSWGPVRGGRRMQVNDISRNGPAGDQGGLFEVCRILSSSLSLDQSLERLISALPQAIGCDRAWIALTLQGGALVVVAATGWTPIALLRDDRAGLADECHARMVSAAAGIESITAEFVVVPIVVDGKAIGALAASGLISSDAAVFRHVADLIGQTVHTHRLIAEDRRMLMRGLHQQQKIAQAAHDPDPASPMVGISRVMLDIVSSVGDLAHRATALLIRGESGVGKELLARTLHAAGRKDGPFVRGDCLSGPEPVLEEALFGREDRKGWIEKAHGGTLYLVGIEALSATLQGRLLRFLTDGEFSRLGGGRSLKPDVRVIAATSRDPWSLVGQGAMLPEFLQALSVDQVLLSPLRDRVEDVPLLADHILTRFNKAHGRHLRLMPEAMDVLMSCHFPGNVRELENCLHRTAIRMRSDVVTRGDFDCSRGCCLSSSLCTRLLFVKD